CGRGRRADSGLVYVAVPGDSIDSFAAEVGLSLCAQAERRQPPGDEPYDRVLQQFGQLPTLKVPHHRNTGRVQVHFPVARLCSTDLLVDATAATLVDGAVLVDEEVVPDVTPVAGTGVGAVDAADDAGRPRTAETVAAGGVVQHDCLAVGRGVR